MPRSAHVLVGCALAVVGGCKEREPPHLVATPATPVVDRGGPAAPPASEPDLGKPCDRDADCGPAAPACMGFGEDNYVASHPQLAVVMHCSRRCEETACPAGYACRRDPIITGVSHGDVVGTVSRWCGKQVTISPVPLAEIPRQVVARYFDAGISDGPVVALYWEGGELVVTAPGSVQRFPSAKAAREAFTNQVDALWARRRDPWPEGTRGPNVPDAIPPGMRKTLYVTRENDALAAVMTPKRLARDGAVLTWSKWGETGGRGLRLYGTSVGTDWNDLAGGLDAFFKLPRPGK
jgi:hypothetical protein